MNTYNKSLVFFLGILAVLASLFSPGVVNAKELRVAIVPFKINAAKDLSFLRNGIVDMLSSRLSWEGKVQVVSREDVQKLAPFGSLTEAAAREIGKKLNADYVLFGSLTVFGDSVSIDARVVDVTGAKPTLTFFNQASNLGEVIPKINQFAEDINQKIFGRALPVARQPVAPASAQRQQAVEESRMNPEKLWHGAGSASGEGVTSSSLNPGFISTRPRGAANQNIYKSRNFNQLINGLALGDVDGDGKVETVMITPDKVLIYRYENQRFIKVQELSNPSYDTQIAVDVANIKGEGNPQIFVTTLGSQKNTLESYVLQYNGQKYVRIVNDSPWYYRVVQVKGKGAVLLGQKQVMGTNPFQEPIYEMKWIGGQYVPQNQVLPGGVANALGVAIGNIRNTPGGGEDVIHFTRSDLLRLTDLSGNALWTASEKAGGTQTYLQMPASDRGVPGNRIYLPMRIVVADLGHKGKTDVLAVTNSEMTGFLLKDFRHFTSCHIAGYSWNNVGLTGNWKTQKISGRISDFAVGDFYNNGKTALVAALVTQEGLIIGMEPQSSVIAWTLSK